MLLNEVAKNIATPAEALIEAAKNWATTAIGDSTLAGKIHEELLGLVEPPLLSAAISAHHDNCLAAAQSWGFTGRRCGGSPINSTCRRPLRGRFRVANCR